MLQRTLQPWKRLGASSHWIKSVRAGVLNGTTYDLSSQLVSQIFADNDHLKNIPDDVIDRASLSPEFMTKEKERLSKRLIKHTRLDKEKAAVWYCSDGRDAVGTAVWASIVDRGCPGVFRFDKSYHGAGMDTSHIGTDARGEFKRTTNHVKMWVVDEPLPRPGAVGEIDVCLENAYDIVKNNPDAKTAVMEGSSGAAYGGPWRTRYVQQLKRIFDDAGVNLIADEVMSGYQRCGVGHFTAIGKHGIVPWAACLGKAISNGTLPISAVVINDGTRYNTEVWGHGATFSGYEIGVWAAHQTLDRHLTSFQEIAELERIVDEYMYTIDLPTRGEGLMWTIEVPGDGDAVRAALYNEYNIRVFGRENRLMVAPLVGTDPDQLACAMDVLREFF